MEEKEENLNNTNQCKSIYIIVKKFGINVYKKSVPIFKEWYTIMFMLLGFSILAIVFINHYYNYNEAVFINNDSTLKTVESLGQVGDYLGGILNPIFAFLSFCLLLITIKIQNKSLKASQKELQLTREELKKSAKAQKDQSNSIKLQNFENTFFNMISLHNEIIAGIKLENNIEFYYPPFDSNINFQKVLLRGNYLARDPKTIYGREAINYITAIIDDFSFKYSYNKNRLFNNVYDLCHDAIQIQIGHYFGNIYQILKFIYLNKDLTKKEKEKYVNLFRAQFSSIELKLLFYHCIGKIGIRKFKKYIEKFQFFEHLTLEKNFNFKFILCRSIYHNAAFNYREDINHFILQTKEECKTKDVSNTDLTLLIQLAYLSNDDFNALNILKESLNKPNSKDSLNLKSICISELEDQIKKSNSSAQEPQ